MGEGIKDPLGLESNFKEVKGVGLLPVMTTLEGQKVVRRVTGSCLYNKKRISGYEIHMGLTSPTGSGGKPFLKVHLPGGKKAWTDGWVLDNGRVAGTYVHGILDSPGFRGEFLNTMRRAKGLNNKKPKQGRLARFHQYDRLADHFEAHCDVEKIIKVLLRSYPHV